MPQGEHDNRRPPSVLLVSPALEEYARTLRAVVGLARHLTAQGCAVSRWSPADGRTDRVEDLVVPRMETRLAQTLGNCGGSECALVGVRLGAYLAARAVAGGLASRAVLWEPVTDPAQYMRDVTRIAIANQLTTYGAVRFSAEALVANTRKDGYMLVDGYRLTAESIDALEAAAAVSPEGLAGVRDRLRFVFWRNRRAFERWKADGFDAVYVPDVRLAWDSIRFFDADPVALYDTTAAWLRP
jgi:hypothetical protein